MINGVHWRRSDYSLIFALPGAGSEAAVSRAGPAVPLRKGEPETDTELNPEEKSTNRCLLQAH